MNGVLNVKVGKIDSIKLSDWLLVIGVVLAPFTALRVFKFGPGEVLLIIWMLIIFGKNSERIRYLWLNVYQFANIAMMVVGGALAKVVYSEPLSITELLSHVFMLLLSTMLVNYYQDSTQEKTQKLIKMINLIGLPLYAFLLVWGLFISNYFLGHNMWMSNRSRFLALALNPHQIGMITGAMVFFTLFTGSIVKKRIVRIFYILCAVGWYVIGTYTNSSSMEISYLGSAIVVVYLGICRFYGKTEEKRRKALITLVIITLILCLVFFPTIKRMFLGWVSADANGNERLDLASSAFKVLNEKPTGYLFGLGPGSHTGRYMRSGNEQEFHNTYVQLMVNSGFVIVLWYVLATLRIIRKPQEMNPFLVGVVVFFLLYGFGGNMNRRVWVWFTYTTVIALSQKENHNEERICVS